MGQSTFSLGRDAGARCSFDPFGCELDFADDAVATMFMPVRKAAPLPITMAIARPCKALRRLARCGASMATVRLM
jgi:hypothetical protein